MNLYRISQTENNAYDTFSAAIVCANSAKKAKHIHPRGHILNKKDWGCQDTWCSSPDKVKVEYIGIAGRSIKRSVILSDFKAG